MKTVKEQVKDFLDIEFEELKKFADSIDDQALESAKNLILEAEKISSTGTPTYELHGTECVHGSAGQVVPGDVVIAISNSGETAELKATVETLKNNGAKIISVTGKPESWLAVKGDVALIAGVDREGDSMNKPPRASILVEIMMLQCLSILLQNERNLTPQQYVKWHPGGSLGKSIRDTEGK